MEEDDLFDPIHFNVPQGTIQKHRAMPITILVSEEACVALLNMKNKGYPVEERLFDNVSRLLLSLKETAKVS